MDVVTSLDELWVGVKGQSNRQIARTLRNVFRNSLKINTNRGRATDGTRGVTYRVQTNSEYY